jgi:hypothetical protein
MDKNGIKFEETIIKVKGLYKTVNLVQITDSHLCNVDLRESQYTMDLAFRRYTNFTRFDCVGIDDLFKTYWILLKLKM